MHAFPVLLSKELSKLSFIHPGVGCKHQSVAVAWVLLGPAYMRDKFQNQHLNPSGPSALSCPMEKVVALTSSLEGKFSKEALSDSVMTWWSCERSTM